MSLFQAAENAIFGSPKYANNQPSTQGVADLFKHVTFQLSTVTAMLADSEMSYTDGAAAFVAENDIILGGGYRYKVAASGATDHDLTTTGGVKLYVLKIAGRYMPDQFLENVSPGTTDMTAAIQAAINKGDTLLDGQYLTSATLVMKSNRELSGAGRGAEIVASTAAWVRYEALASAVETGLGGTPFVSGSKPIISNENPDSGDTNITLRNFKITGNTTGPNHMVHVREIDGLRIEDCHSYEGLSAFAVLKSYNVRITNNRVEGYRNGGIDTWEGCKRVIIANNTILGRGPNSDGSNIGIFVTAQPTDKEDTVSHTAEDYNVSDNVIFGSDNYGIWVGGGDTSNVGNEVHRANISGNVLKDIDGTGIEINEGQDVTVINNHLSEIGGNGVFSRTLATGGAAVRRLRVINNTFENIGATVANSEFVSLDLTTNDAEVTGNVGTGSSHVHALYNRGTNSRLLRYGNDWEAGTTGTINDLGIDSRTIMHSSHLEATAAWDAPSIASGAQSSTTITVTGAALGDFVRVASSSSFSGMQLWAEVTAADTVTVYLTNNTGGTLDASNRNITVLVDRV